MKKNKESSFFLLDQRLQNTDHEDVYRRLESFLLSYQELVDVKCAESGEDLMPVSSAGILFQNLDKRMETYTGKDIYVRKTVLDLLVRANTSLKSYCKSWEIEVVYGYRHPQIQQESYNKIKEEMQSSFVNRSELEVKEAIHRMVAVPDVAGHPTGGAVDVRVKNDNVCVDMGTEIYEFSKDCYTFSPFISPETWKNRQILRNIMLKQGFAPYDGEWWHFSYGDREWAKYYGYPQALYDQKDELS